MPYSSDIPFGVVGRVFGLRVRQPELEPGEEIRWEARANRFQQKIRSVGGRLYLTDRRLIFAPSRFETRVGGRAWSAGLHELERAFAGGSIRTVRVVTSGGPDQRFVVGQKDETAATIDAAIRSAKAKS
jgi:hypothetical protein